MRGFIVYYLKILLAFYAFHEIACGTLGSSKNVAYEKMLKLRSLPFEDCGSKYQVMYLKIDSCSSIPCTMKRKSIVKVTVLFNDNGNGVTFLKHEVRWLFNYVKSQAAISPDPCDGDHNCIGNVNDSKTYWANIFVNETLSLLRGKMLWESKDALNQNLICFEVPVEIIA